MIDKQFFKSIHEEYCTQHQIIEDWYKSPTDDEILKLTVWNTKPYELYLEMEKEDMIDFARAVEELIRTKNEL